MTPQEELLTRAADEYRAFHQAIDGLSEPRLTEAWLGTWSVKEIVAHMVGWHRELQPALERIARGERPIPAGVSYDEVEAWNAKFGGAMSDRGMAEVLRAFAGSHDAFLRAAANIPEERFQPGRAAYKIVDLNTAHHYKEHGDQIRAWRAARGV